MKSATITCTFEGTIATTLIFLSSFPAGATGVNIPEPGMYAASLAAVAGVLYWRLRRNK